MVRIWNFRKHKEITGHVSERVGCWARGATVPFWFWFWHLHPPYLHDECGMNAECPFVFLTEYLRLFLKEGLMRSSFFSCFNDLAIFLLTVVDTHRNTQLSLGNLKLISISDEPSRFMVMLVSFSPPPLPPFIGEERGTRSALCQFQLFPHFKWQNLSLLKFVSFTKKVKKKQNKKNTKPSWCLLLRMRTYTVRFQ